MTKTISRGGVRLRAPLAIALLASAALYSVATVQAQAATFLGWPTAISYVSPGSELRTWMPPKNSNEQGTEIRSQSGVEPGTNPSTAGRDFVSYEFKTAFQAYAGAGLWINVNGSISHSESLGMAPNTSPSIAYPGYAFAFQANTTALWVNHTNTSLGMAGGTSPSITPSGVVAFQANTGELWIYRPGMGGTPTHLGMWPGTSPSIAETAGGGWTVAFHAYGNGRLWTYSSNGVTVDTGDGMASGTSPSIAPCEGFIVAFQASGSQDLWTYSSSGIGTDRKVAILAGTSPSIACRTEASWEAAFHGAKNNWLETYSPLTGTVVPPGQVMRADSSPSIGT